MNVTNLTPSGARLLVKRLDEAKMQSKYIEVIQHETAPSMFALVLAVGAKVREKLVPGDQIITKPFSGTPITVTTITGEQVEAYMIVEDDVLAVEAAQ